MNNSFESMKTNSSLRALNAATALLALLVTAHSLQAASDLQPLRSVNGFEPGMQFGNSVAAVGADRFAVSAPYADYSQRFLPTVTNAGFVQIYDLNTNY